jgi:hypothetical protein
MGAPISLTIAPGGRLSLSVLPGYDALTFSSRPLYPVVSPCTVAAVTPPILAAGGGERVTVNGVDCSVDGQWAAAYVTVHPGPHGYDAVQVLVGHGSTWMVVNRAVVCLNHDITPSFYQTACGTS